MARKFKLTPITTHLAKKEWELSTYKGSCYVGADSEDEARTLAIEEYGIAREREPRGNSPSAPAWRFSTHVECKEVPGEMDKGVQEIQE